MATTTTSAAAVARAVFDAFNAHDASAMRELWADDVTERFPDTTITGPDALAAYFKELWAGLPDVRLEPVAIVEDGEDVLVHWRMTATHTGTFQGVKPTGTAFTADGFDHMTVRDGKMAANFVVFDRQGIAQQLGLLPPDGSGQERMMKAAFNARTALKERLARR